MQLLPPHNLLASLGLLTGNTKKYPFGCRDNPDVHVLRDLGTNLIYLDWDESTFSHTIDYSNSRQDQSNLYFPEDISNSEYRINKVLPYLKSHTSILDYGCGRGHFIKKLASLIGNDKCTGFDICESSQANLQKSNINFLADFKAQNCFDIITCFHVFEHLSDPLTFLSDALNILNPSKGKLIIEVPHALDPLIVLYDNQPFLKHTFWSQHLILHTSQSLQTMALRAGFSKASVTLYQRYSLANHLYWINNGLPGGHTVPSLLPFNNPYLSESYSRTLFEMGLSDTLFMVCEV